MARGGRRKGEPGKAYPQRSDLTADKKPLAPMKIPGQGYGEQAQQVAAQEAVPMAASPLERLANYTGPGPDAAPTLLSGETERPHEPLTAGLPIGPGAGPGPGTGGPRIDRPGVDDLRAMYAAFPYEGIARLLRWAEK